MVASHFLSSTGFFTFGETNQQTIPRDSLKKNQATRFVEASGDQNLACHPGANPCCPPVEAATLPPGR